LPIIPQLPGAGMIGSDGLPVSAQLIQTPNASH